MSLYIWLLTHDRGDSGGGGSSSSRTAAATAATNRPGGAVHFNGQQGGDGKEGATPAQGRRPKDLRPKDPTITRPAACLAGSDFPCLPQWNTERWERARVSVGRTENPHPLVPHWSATNQL
mmetsp:Transcript_59165/g.133981  ORF Transcript_59165/g.133981 Transcript_59165/m.133981 type:complete len:121 (+) Transcript_59165:376-738(+)